MAVNADSPAPYAPASAVLELVKRYRNRGLPTPVDAGVLARAGVSDSLINRTAQALVTLELVDEEGRPTEILEGIRRSPEAEYQMRLTEWLNHVYSDILTFLDPSTDDETAVRDAFRHYNPVGQQPRMVSLFTGLFRAAGIMPEPQGQVVRRYTRPVKLNPGKSNGSRRGGVSIETNDEERAPKDQVSKESVSEGQAKQHMLVTPEQVLLDLLDPIKMEKIEQDAVWTLLLYLKRSSQASQRNEAS